MLRNAAIVHTDFRIYWPARLNALRKYFADKGVVLSIIEISGKGSPYDFAGATADGGSQWHCLFKDLAMERIPAEDAVKMVLEKLDELQPDIVIAGAIAFPSGAAATRWGVLNRKPVVIFDDARLEDVPRSRLVNWVKKSIYSNVRAMLIPAPSHDATYRYYGFSSDQIFYGVNCIDNALFEKRSSEEHKRLLRELTPHRYFLAVGRQVEKKNWLSLLRAFMRVADRSGIVDWSLVFIGDGPDHEQLKTEAGNSGRVIFLPFMTQDHLRTFYSNAGALVLPSQHGETWGLVVNEAMASGAPVLVSEKCGSADTLVHEGVNGFVFSPDEHASIEDILERFVRLSPEKRVEMGDASKQIISEWGLDRFCNGMWDACTFAYEHRQRSGSIAGKVIIRFWNGRYRPT